jgi:sugar transferase (PEP-CTERM/EpsH1 system associated)
VRILFLTHRLPYAPNRGDRIRSHYLVRVLAAAHEVHLVSLVHDAEEHGRVRELERVVASVHPVRVRRVFNLLPAAAMLAGSRPLTHVLLHGRSMKEVLRSCIRAAPPDLVVAYCTGMARYAVEPPLASIPCVLDLVDLDSQKWAALAESTRGPKRWIYRREAHCLRAFERIAVAHARATIVVSERERTLVEEALPGSRPIVVPIGLDVTSLSPPGPPAAAPRVVFCGVFSYPPNDDAARWLVSEVWPLVKRWRPDAELTLVGLGPSRSLRALARDSSIYVTGAVPDVRPYLWQASVAVAPVSLARGVQTKVLEAVAASLPCVVTPQVLEGLPQSVRRACLTASAPEAFARHIVSLLAKSPDERRRLAQSAEPHTLDWEQALRPFLDIVESSLSFPRNGPESSLLHRPDGLFPPGPPRSP